MSIVLGLEYLASHLFALSSGFIADSLQDHFVRDQNGVHISLKFDEGRFLWEALEMPFLRVKDGPRIPADIAYDDMIPAPKRVTMTVSFSSGIRVVVDRPSAGVKGGPYSATFDLAVPQTPRTLEEAPFKWVRGFLVQVYPNATQEAMVGQSKPTGIPFVDNAFPGQPLLPPEAFGLDEIRVTTSYDPGTKAGGVESVELVFSTPESIQSPPFPAEIPRKFLFRNVSPEGVSVELHFDGTGSPTLAQIDGAVLLPNVNDGLTALPLQWTAHMPTLFAGSFDAEAEDADPPFPLGAIRETMEAPWILNGVDHLLIYHAELTCDFETKNFETKNFEFIGQCSPDEPVQIAGLSCTDVVITFKWRSDQARIPRVAVLRGIAHLDEPTYFRVALVWLETAWIAAIEANYSSQKVKADVPLAELVAQLPKFQTPERHVNDLSMESQTLLLEEQRRASQNDFNELIGE